MTSPLIVDAHEDLAWNILAFGRDYTRSAKDTRQVEAGQPAPQHNGDTLLGWPDYQRGRVAVVFGTLFASPMRRRLGDWETQTYADLAEAHRIYRDQLHAYESLTPPPYGDTVLEEAVRTFGRQTTLLGGIDQLDLLRKGTPQEIESEVTRILDLVRGRCTFILGTTDYFNENTPQDKIRALAEAGRRHGRL